MKAKIKIAIIAMIVMSLASNAQDETIDGVLRVNGSIETRQSQTSSSYPNQTSRGDIFQLYHNQNNTLEIGVAGNYNTRRSWILSRHHDLSGSYGKYYSTLHLQPDTGDKSEYRGIAIGYDASIHVSKGTHLAINGNVGIGTTNPGTWKLAVNGKIRAKEIKVETGWSDFVFEKDYYLPTLTEVEKHIKKKGHLKNIPSAKEVKENGIFLGEMDAKLLQKIEELTLYTIQQEKKINSLEKENESLKNMNLRLLELQRRVENLENK